MEWVYAALVTVAVVVLFLAAAKGARGDVMPPVMRADVDTYLDAEAERIAVEQAEWVENLILANGPYREEVVASEERRSVRVTTPPPADVENWRSLVEAYFPADRVDQALKVIWCESRGDSNAKNPNSTASGLFQILRGWWSGSWSTAIGPFDPFDPAANVAAASKIAGGSRYWSDWAASRSCHGL